MKILIKLFYILTLIFGFTIFNELVEKIFAQVPPPLPPPPHQVPWENLILTVGLCIGYGILKIFRKIRK